MSDNGQDTPPADPVSTNRPTNRPKDPERGRGITLLAIRGVRMLWRMLGAILLAANLVAWAWILDASDGLKAQALVTAQYILAFSFLVTLAREILSPRNAELRVVPLSDYRALRLFTVLRALLFIILATHWMIYLVEANEWSESVAVLMRLAEQVGLIFFGWGALRRSGLLEKLVPENTDTYLGLLMRLLVRVILPIGVLTLLFYIVATALGYGALSAWVVRNAAWTAGTILVVGILYRLLQRQLHKTMSFMRNERVADTEEGAAASTPWYIGVERILGGLIKIVTGFLLVHWTLQLWSVRWSDIAAVLDRRAFIGGGTWGDLLGGFGMAAFAWLAYAFVRNVLIFMVFPAMGVESGARYAMLTVLKYVAFAAMGILILTAVGADASTLAVFAGGASVGLGFAMKDIFSNFFGGLIMLFERPVRVGDTIEVSGIKGKVEAIRLRGTLLRTFDGTTVMIPNTSMISTNLANLTHGFETARMQVDVGVSYGEDPAKIEKILLEIAHADPRVIGDPEPAVRFTNFGASSLDFSLRIWTQNLDERWAMVSEMRHRIFERFQKEGIEIPFNQMDLHIRSDQRERGETEPAPEVTPDTREASSRPERV